MSDEWYELVVSEIIGGNQFEILNSGPLRSSEAAKAQSRPGAINTVYHYIDGEVHRTSFLARRNGQWSPWHVVKPKEDSK